jgi:hypothetical protein
VVGAAGGRWAEKKPSADPIGQNDHMPRDNREGRPLEGGNRDCAGFEADVSVFIEAREILAEFHMIIPRKAVADAAA